ncbi:MAG: hypothetical protein MPN21_23910 [Thermoanaerobaculia bacterium]|nr:hypothetical protein [Thermoanaerobaculia bacterium]
MTDIFTLEALRARHGDCLILHYGPEDSPQRVLIDGGPARVWSEFLELRLRQLRDEEALPAGEPLRFRMLMVSHVDADHIVGVIDLLEATRDDVTVPYRFRTLWHNSFDDALGGEDAADAAVRETSVAVGLASLDPESLPSSLPVDDHSALALASIRQGRTLRLLAEELGIPFNKTDGQDPDLLLVGHGADMRHGLRFELLGPSQAQVDALRTSWKSFLDEQERRRREEEEAPETPAELAEFVDRSVPNLSSLVIWAEKDGKVMLLTGDARGDFILTALEESGRLEPGERSAVEIDLLKMPHHGSDRNVDDIFFERIRARHYVFSGDGFHGNPEPKTFELLLRNRQPEHGSFSLHLTYPAEDFRLRKDDYPLDELESILQSARDRGLEFDVVTTGPGDLSLSVDL